MKTLEPVFNAALTDSLSKAAAQLKIDLSRDIGQITKLGGVRFMQNLLRRGLESPGFAQMAEKKLPKFSAEAVCVRGEFGLLFTDDEINLCFDRLCEHGFYQV